MKDITVSIKEAAQKQTKFSFEDLKQGIKYLEDYYNEFPEEKGDFPNYGELDNYFKNEKFLNALMDGDDDPLVLLVDQIAELFFVNKK